MDGNSVILKEKNDFFKALTYLGTESRLMPESPGVSRILYINLAS